MRNSPTSTVDTAYERLRDRLVGFAVKPGARLNESELASEMAMSRAPIREALNRLTTDGLVRFEPGRGFFCRRLSVSEIADLYAVRLDLEIGALQTLARTGDDAGLGAFAATWRAALAQDAPACCLEDLVDSDEAFHLDLAGMAGNPPRLHYLGKINDRIRFVRRINLETPARRAAALAEHARLLDALEARDQERAIAALRDHLDRSHDEIRQQVQAAIARIYADETA